MQRPTGVTILAVLAAIGGIFGILAGIALLGVGSFVAAYAGAGGLAFVFGLVLLVLGIAELALAYGFWTAKAWGWQYGILLAVVNIVVAILEVVLGYAQIGGVIVSIVIAAILIYYLNTPDVRRYFAAPEKGWPFIGGCYFPGFILVGAARPLPPN
jgi:hypothetical protein